MRVQVQPPSVSRTAARVRELLKSYQPPSFEEVPTPDAALFLTAIDHRSGYRGGHLVEGSGPFEGSALLWALGLRAERQRPGSLSAPTLVEASEARLDELFGIEGETLAGTADRAALWRDLAEHLLADYGGRAEALIAASEGRLGGRGGLLGRLGEAEAFSDPLQKKSFLVCKIWERRRWLRVEDPDSWQVCADNVLMRLALRAGLVRGGEVEQVRAATRMAWKQVAEQAEVSPPLLDDLLWERGREDPDLLGAAAGDVREPPRPEGTLFY
jgi:hypothetical protein